MNTRPYFILFVLFLFAASSSASEQAYAGRLGFEANRGQWPAQVQYKADLQNGRLFLEGNKFTYVYYNPSDLEAKGGRENSSELPTADATVRCHAYQVCFSGASETKVLATEKKPGYVNYFIGNDPAKWASHVNVYNRVLYPNLYPSVDMLVYSQDGNLKYDFIVKDLSELGNIRMSYEGVDGISVVGGNLVLKTSVNEIVEQKPYAYQVVNGVRKEVRCRYVLDKNCVSFSLVTSCDPSLPLVIDPLIVASTYAGSTLVTWGFCGTYDAYGNIYTGGISFGVGYPVTTGAYDITFAGGVDIGISKMDPAGSSLLYATYLGGGNRDYPHSLVVNSRNELCVYGSSGSADYPVSAGCFDPTYNGGISDIIVSHLDSTGSALLGSTYVGGNDSDAYNVLTTNIGDEFKGEIITDDAGHIYIASYSTSPNFPVTPDARAYAGSQDAVFFELDATCSNLLWSTCLGGAADDAGYGIRLHPSGDVFVTGGTRSSDFPVTPGSYSSTVSGGFLARLVPASASITVATYLGAAMDQSFFVDLDEANNVYVLGQTNGSFPITPGTYGNPGGKTFIAKFNETLTTLAFQTALGATSFNKGIAPTAFLVDRCGNIYFSGFSNASGYPISPDAIYSNISVGNFYLCVLAQNGSSLKHATYLPGEHVDGGTSRYDKKGVVYQTVCQGTPTFPTLPNAFCPNLLTTRDVCVLKIDFQVAHADASVSISPSLTGCQPFPVSFTNQSSGVNYVWNFGDGTPLSSLQHPTHLFNDTGNFQVSLIAMDPLSCNLADTAWLSVRVYPGLPHHPNVDTVLCNVPSIMLHPSNSGTGLTFEWSNDSTSQSIVASVPGIFWVDVSNEHCTMRDSFVVHHLMPPYLGADTFLCEGQSVLLSPSGTGSSFLWSTGDTSATLLANQDTLYWVEVNKLNCRLRDTMELNLLEMPVVNLGPDSVLCPYSIPAVALNAGNSPGIVTWSTGSHASQVVAMAEGRYWVEINNAQCRASDTIRISVAQPKVVAQDDTYFCDFSNALLDSKADHVRYLWNTGDTTKVIHIKHPGEYWYTISYNGCAESDTLAVTGVYGEDILFIPTAFTPDANGINDVFIPKGSDVLKFKMHIFNRWGIQIFHSESLENGWDGTYDNRDVEGGVFAYIMEYTTRCSDETRKRAGTFLLVR